MTVKNLMTWRERGFNEAKSHSEARSFSFVQWAEIYGAPEYKGSFGLRNKSIRKQLGLHSADTECISVSHHIHQRGGLSPSQRAADMEQTSLRKSDLNTATPDTCFRYFSLSALPFFSPFYYIFSHRYVSALIFGTF